MSTQLYEFQPPNNMEAIRTNIINRIKQRKENDKQSMTPTLSPTSEKLPFSHLDNGLPSPPIESCAFEEKEAKLPTEMVMSALLELSSTKHEFQSPPSPVLSCSKSSPASSVVTDTEAIRLKIKSLQEEKHRLFQVMKDLLSKPKDRTDPPATTLVPPNTPQDGDCTHSSSNSSSSLQSVNHTHPNTNFNKNNTNNNNNNNSHNNPTHNNYHNHINHHINLNNNNNNNHVRPSPSIIRSRSISHNEYRPASRYGNYYDHRRTSTRFYGGGGYDNRGYNYTPINNSSNINQTRPYPSSISSSSTTYMVMFI
ncbi:hypothetical protein BDB01DRAFT_771774 [Pilobolus umbonatus]|nr:hypothetical protein BDB01DRAFT_771774 [Pilobolus umbonatus]